MADHDLDTIRHALDRARDGGLRSVKLRHGDFKFRAVLTEDSFVEAEPDADVEDGPRQIAVKSTAVGYVHLKPEGLKVGDTVTEGQPVAEVVALGIANEIVAKAGGTVVELAVEDQQAVEYGQTLVVIES